MTETVMRKIKSRFSLLVIEVQKSMVSHKIDASIVQQFLLNFFEGDCDIPEDAGLSKIFNSVTKARLWRQAMITMALFRSWQNHFYLKVTQ